MQQQFRNNCILIDYCYVDSRFELALEMPDSAAISEKMEPKIISTHCDSDRKNCPRSLEQIKMSGQKRGNFMNLLCKVVEWPNSLLSRVEKQACLPPYNPCKVLRLSCDLSYSKFLQ